MMVLSNVIVHLLSAITFNDKKIWVRVGNLYPLHSSLFKVDTFISACKLDTIFYMSGCTACNAAAGQLFSVGVSLW